MTVQALSAVSQPVVTGPVFQPLDDAAEAEWYRQQVKDAGLDDEYDSIERDALSGI